MPKSTPIDTQTQLTHFTEACELLGGNHAAARELKVSERTIRFLRAGERNLHDGFLRDISAALIRRADQCRALERRISPAFAANLTERQAERQGKRDARRYDQGED